MSQNIQRLREIESQQSRLAGEMDRLERELLRISSSEEQYYEIERRLRDLREQSRSLASEASFLQQPDY